MIKKLNFITLSFLALALTGCGGNPGVDEDGYCTEEFVEDYNALLSTQSNTAQVARATTVSRSSMENLKSALIEAREEAVAFGKRYKGVTCDAKNRQTGFETTVFANDETSRIVSKYDELLRDLQALIDAL